MTFSEWKRLELVREYIPQIVNIELEQLQTWREYISAVYYADRCNIHSSVDALCEKLEERDQLISLMGIVWTMDYASITHKIAQEHGFGSFMSGLSLCGSQARAVIAGALLQRD